MTPVPNKTFRGKMEALRGRADRPTPAEIASMALDSGLSASEALKQIERFAQFGPADDSEAYDGVAEFIAEICGENFNGKALEFTARPNLLSAATHQEQGKAAAHLIIRNVDYAEAYLKLFPEAHILNSVEELDPSAQFGCIICQPAIGNRSRNSDTDGFGGEVIKSLAAHLGKNGRLFWLTARGALFSKLAGRTMNALTESGLHLVARLDVPSGAFMGTNIEASLIVLERQAPYKILVGALRDLEAARAVAKAMQNGSSKKLGASWAWLEINDRRIFSDLEREQLLKRLSPRGRFTKTRLGALILDDKIERADKPLSAESLATAYLYVPEYAASQVTADLEEQTVKPRAVYRVPINTARANPRFLAMLFNSPYGRELRSMAAQGTTIQRISIPSIKEISLPLPPLETQDQIARVGSDLSLLVSSFEEIKDTLQRDWTALPEIGERVDSLKSVLDIEQQIENWWRELPYPLATIYRRYQVSTDPKERLDRLLHFFEMAAVYLAAIGTSHVKALRHDWQEHFAKWFHPADVAGIERADFGFWTTLAGASLKDLSRIASTPDLRESANDAAGPELVEVARSLGTLSKTSDILDTVRRYRNSWKGHGGHLKSSDAVRLDGELQQYVRDFYEATSKIFRRFVLVRPGLADVSDKGYTYQIDLLAGSDPAFERQNVELAHPAKSHSLAFWMKGAGITCRALPFFRLGAPQEPQETSFYVFNRVENGGFRWISYQEAREQEFVAPDEELHSLIGLPKGDAK